MSTLRIEGNSLIWKPGQSPDERAYELDGTWFLKDKLELGYRLRRNQIKQGFNAASFKARILKADPESLTVDLSYRESRSTTHTQTVTLGGTWAVNRSNELTFSLERKTGSSDRLTFKGGWTLDKHYNIIYTARQGIEQISLSGLWHLVGENHLRFVLSGSAQALDVKAQLGSIPLRAKQNTLRYQIEIGARKATRSRLSWETKGSWRWSQNLRFDFTHRQGVHTITDRFEGRLSLLKNKTTELSLKGQYSLPHTRSLTLRLDKTFPSGWEGFIEASAGDKESSVWMGLKLPI